MTSDPPRLRGWHGNIVQVNTEDGHQVHLRHRDHPDQVLTFPRPCWRVFVEELQLGLLGDVPEDPAQAA